MENFISTIKTAVIGSLDNRAYPFSSYAPYIYDQKKFYIYISDIVTHAKNIKANPHTSLFFAQDESETENLFARKRISLQCLAQKIDRDTSRFEEVFDCYHEKFDSDMVTMLKSMSDFNLYELSVESGEATFGFGEAYVIGGEDMDELVARQGGSGHGHKKA
jgi:heme iron utilization protein